MYDEQVSVSTIGSREKGNNNYGRTSKPANPVHLSTSQTMTRRQELLVNIRRAELVKIKRAPTVEHLSAKDMMARD